MRLAVRNLFFIKKRTETSQIIEKEIPIDTENHDNDLSKTPARDLISFWILGLCTEFGYILMICAAFDILHRFDDSIETKNGEELCTSESPGILLLADIVPSLMMNFICPFLPLAMNIRMTCAILLQVSSFLLVAFATTKVPAIFGVMCTSMALGLGEVTLLSYSAKFDRDVIKAWSSGTGGAGIIGSFSYAALIALGIEPNDTLKLMLVMPVIEAIAYWFLLRAPPQKSNDNAVIIPTIATVELNHYSTTKVIFTLDNSAKKNQLKSLKEKIKFIPKILPFMLPLITIFLLEYTMVSGLFEMIYVENIWLDHQSQYRWYQFVYQIGVFMARSIGTSISIQSVWWMSLGQLLNVIYFITEIGSGQLTNIWLIFVIVFWVGIVGGLGYIHTFWRIATEVPQTHQKFSLGIMTIAESCGIAFGGLSAIPIHKFLCAKLKRI